MGAPRTWWKVRALDADYDGASPEQLAKLTTAERRRVSDVGEANTIASLGTDGLHYPAIDLDGVGVHLVDSSTVGNVHLYLDRGCSWPDYVALLEALERCGLVQPGWVAASIERGATHLRVRPDKAGYLEEASVASNAGDQPGELRRLWLAPANDDVLPGVGFDHLEPVPGYTTGEEPF